MAKRNQPQKEFHMFGCKKPKLSISITKRPITTARKHNEDLWDDDDDDVILLATQYAESQAFGACSMTTAAVTNNTEITFSEFMPSSSTSTQRAPIESTTSKAVTIQNDLVSQMLADDDDDDFVMVSAAVESLNVQEPKTKTNNDDFCVEDIVETFGNAEFKEPEHRNFPTTGFEKEAAATTAPQNDSSAARRQLASERQIKFLIDRVDALKKENNKLNKDLSDTKAKIESKDGEASLLRDELRHMRNQMQALKMDKILKNDLAKNECQHKLDAMSRQIEAKETELQLKTVECSILKMRQADESKRVDSSMLPLDETINTNVQQSKLKEPALMRISRLKVNILSHCNNNSTIAKLQVHQINQLKQQHRTSYEPFELHMSKLKHLIIQIQTEENVKNISRADDSFIEKIKDSAKIVFEELSGYLHTLEYVKNCQVYPYQQASTVSDFTEEHDLNTLIKREHLYIDERVVCLRRYVAMLCLCCQLLPALPQQLLSMDNSLQMLAMALFKLGFSTDLHKHFGVLEAMTYFLHILLTTLTSDTINEQHVKILVDGILKQLIFLRPNAWIFLTLTDCMLQCCRLPSALTMLCTNSSNITFLSDHISSVYRFTHESCIIQVYAGLLEITLPFGTALNRTQFELLMAISENHVRFVFNCFAKPPTFIHNCLPNYSEEEATITDQHQQCECYTKLCLSVVTLLFQLLHTWTSHSNFKNYAQIGTISKIAVQLLHIIFCDFYLTCLFRNAEELTKQYLSLICKWWQENADVLNFSSLHMQFLQNLQNSHIVQKCMADEINNITADLSTWGRLTKDNISNVSTTNVRFMDELVEAVENIDECFNIQK